MEKKITACEGTFGTPSRIRSHLAHECWPSPSRRPSPSTSSAARSQAEARFTRTSRRRLAIVRAGPPRLRRRHRPLAASITASSPPPPPPPPSPHRRHGTAAAPPLTRLSPAAPLSAGRQDLGQAQPVPGRRVRQVRVLQPARVGQGPPRARHHPGRRGARRAQAGRHRRRGEPFRKSFQTRTQPPHTAAALPPGDVWEHRHRRRDGVRAARVRLRHLHGRALLGRAAPADAHAWRQGETCSSALSGPRVGAGPGLVSLR